MHYHYFYILYAIHNEQTKGELIAVDFEGTNLDNVEKIHFRTKEC